MTDNLISEEIRRRKRKEIKDVCSFLLKGAALFLKQSGGKLGKRMMIDKDKAKKFVDKQLAPGRELKRIETAAYQKESIHQARIKGKVRAVAKFNQPKQTQKDISADFLYGKDYKKNTTQEMFGGEPKL